MIAAAAALLRRLRVTRSGVAATEFALSVPLLLTMGLWGTETVNLVITNMRVSQIAMQIADNASRIGDQSMLVDRKIYETDINDLLDGAEVQAGKLDLYGRGRVIVSSLEVVPGTADRQYIHWQRCRGLKSSTSAYGNEGKGLDGSLAGMGPAGEEVTATAGDAVMFVEIVYDYQPLIANAFTGSAGPRTIRTTAAFNVRDDRDLSQIFQRDPTRPAPTASCATFSR